MAIKACKGIILLLVVAVLGNSNINRKDKMKVMSNKKKAC